MKTIRSLFRVWNVSRWFAASIALSFFSAASAQNNVEEQSSSVSSVQIERCQQLFRDIAVPYQALGRLLPLTFRPAPNVATHQLLHLKIEQCQSRETIGILEKSLQLHGGKVAILLPLSQWPLALRQSIVAQVNGLVQGLGLDPLRKLIWVDTAAQPGGLEAQLAPLVFLHHAAMFIGGITQGEAQILSRWSERLQIPTIVLNRRLPPQRSKQLFYLGPDPRLLASSLTRHALSRGIRKVAILMPQSSRDGPLVDHFIAQAQHLRLNISGPYLYNPNDFESIDTVLRKIFHIDPAARSEEQLELVRHLKDKAQQEGVAFDPRNAVLPAQLDVDAIFIVDHFKNVRHLAKAFAYYGVKRLPLLGIPKWRAFELVDASEDILRGSVFVDYVGSYKKLPYRIAATPMGSEFFVPSSEVDTIDLKLLVSHAVYAAQQALSGKREARPQLYKRLEAARPPQGEFFAVPTIFRRDHLSYWPSFLFAVGEGSVQMMQVWNPTLSDAR